VNRKELAGFILAPASEPSLVNNANQINGMENFWKQLKGSIRSTHIHVSQKHLHKYAKEFEYRSRLPEGGSQAQTVLNQASVCGKETLWK
jgi:hypothetical protein